MRFTTAGESHGPALVAIIEGFPSGVELSAKRINLELARRQLGAGRGQRMEIEKDEVEILSGLRFGKSLGSPIALLIRNKDWVSWSEEMAIEGRSTKSRPLTNPRPGHGDLAGILKRGHEDIRSVLERASARETASRVAVGAIAKAFLAEFGISVLSHVLRIGEIEANYKSPPWPKDLSIIDGSPVRCLDPAVSKQMVSEIEKASRAGDTLGGIFEVLVYGAPPGLGDYTSWDKRLGGQLAQAIMSIPAVKGVEVGGGFKLAAQRGSGVHDEIFYDSEKGFYRRTNRAGGLEGGMTNGEVVILRGAMKPISTLGKPLRTVNLVSKRPEMALKERADVCAVPSAAVIAESMTAIIVAQAILEKFGSDSLADILESYQKYRKRLG